MSLVDTPAAPRTKNIKVDYLARVEGEGAMHIKIKGDRVADVQFRIFEPPRFFEAFLEGRMYTEAPDITARICGICPVAYQMSSVRAMEDAFGVEIDGQINALRRLLYCGEWIESHGLHVYLLHAPDFLGYQDGIQMAADFPEAVVRGLKLKKIGNELMTLVGGREIHPINVRVGGFYRAPTKRDLLAFEERLKWARDAAIQSVEWVSTFDFPDFDRDYEFVSLRHDTDYPIERGHLVSNTGLNISVCEYEDHFEESHVARSNALHSVHKGHGNYFVGPLARYSLNFAKLSPIAQEAACFGKLGPTCTNPFKGIVVRAVELVYACDEALRIIHDYEQPEKPFVDMRPYVKAGIGHGCTEAPRGILYHRYTLDEQGKIVNAKITPPTSQNQPTIEDDLREYVTPRVSMPLDTLQWQCEQAVRNYDPCISCATHFIKLQVEPE